MSPGLRLCEGPRLEWGESPRLERGESPRLEWGESPRLDVGLSVQRCVRSRWRVGPWPNLGIGSRLQAWGRRSCLTW